MASTGCALERLSTSISCSFQLNFDRQVYNPTTNRWRSLPKMNTPRWEIPLLQLHILILLQKYCSHRSNFSLLVLDGMLTAIGGFTGSATTASMEVLHNGVWLHRPDHGWLPVPR